MAKSFSATDSVDHTFEINGETFTWCNVRPEVLTAFQPSTNGDEKDETDTTAVWKQLDEQIKIFLVPEDHERWDHLRTRDENPVMIWQLNDLLEWLVGTQTERPTQTPSPSGSGPGRTARSLKAA